MFMPFSIHETLPGLKLISLHPEHIKSDLLPSHPEALLSFFSFFFSKICINEKKNVFLICVALYPSRTETLPYMRYRYVPLMDFEQFWSEKGYII